MKCSKVLIPFQFPSNGKAYPKFFTVLIVASGFICFNSLQTGKHIQSIQPSVYFLQREDKFQFPSNGKAYPKSDPIDWVGHDRVSIPFKRESISKVNLLIEQRPSLEVSIPFKRESISKEFAEAVASLGDLSGFNSLQTGKRIQSRMRRTGTMKSRKFQFPSNGKADPKANRRCCRSLDRRSFNSLQTGKRIQREEVVFGPYIFECFNSLQTGKRIQRNQFHRSGS